MSVHRGVIRARRSAPERGGFLTKSVGRTKSAGPAVLWPALDFVKLLHRIPPTKPIWVRMKPFSPAGTSSGNGRPIHPPRPTQGGCHDDPSNDFRFRCSGADRRRRRHLRRRHLALAGSRCCRTGSLMLKDIKVDVNKLAINDYEDMSLVFSKH